LNPQPQRAFLRLIFLFPTKKAAINEQLDCSNPTRSTLV
jgi:hypothetical protein